jgi:hypothetical protein
MLSRGVVLARTAALRVEFNELVAFRQALLRDADMRSFYNGESRRLPDFLRHRLLDRLGRYADALPDDRRHDWAPIATGQGTRLVI